MGVGSRGGSECSPGRRISYYPLETWFQPVYRGGVINQVRYHEVRGVHKALALSEPCASHIITQRTEKYAAEILSLPRKTTKVIGSR
jgi:hypothetical protein